MSRDPLEKIYQELYGHSMDLMEEYDAPLEAVAGTLMAIAMRLYKTSLSEENFNKMKEVIGKPTSNRIERESSIET